MSDGDDVWPAISQKPNEFLIGLIHYCDGLMKLSSEFMLTTAPCFLGQLLILVPPMTGSAPGKENRCRSRVYPDPILL
jgi:hypothetical protein